MRIHEGAKRVTIAQGSTRSRTAFLEGRRVRARARVVGMPRAWRATWVSFLGEAEEEQGVREGTFRDDEFPDTRS